MQIATAVHKNASDDCGTRKAAFSAGFRVFCVFFALFVRVELRLFAPVLR
jgi:hypothetical protein